MLTMARQPSYHTIPGMHDRGGHGWGACAAPPPHACSIASEPQILKFLKELKPKYILKCISRATPTARPPAAYARPAMARNPSHNTIPGLCGPHMHVGRVCAPPLCLVLAHELEDFCSNPQGVQAYKPIGPFLEFVHLCPSSNTESGTKRYPGKYFVVSRFTILVGSALGRL